MLAKCYIYGKLSVLKVVYFLPLLCVLLDFMFVTWTGHCGLLLPFASFQSSEGSRSSSAGAQPEDRVASD